MFQYFGSKNRLASSYQPPTHETIVEPFAGAAAYSVYWLIQTSDTEALLYDVDPNVVKLWRRLLNMSPQDLLDYPNPTKGEMSRDLLWGSVGANTSAWHAVTNGNQFQVTEWMARDFPIVKRKMAFDLAEIGGGRIKVFHSTYVKTPDMDATWFIDPPYQHQGQRYVFGSNGIDYTHLSEWVQSRRGQTIVAEASPADWLPFVPHTQTYDQNGQPKVELVWYSEPDLTLF